jgi:hypothetical protein
MILAFTWLNSNGQNLKGNVGTEDSHHPNASKGSSGTGLVNVDLFTGRVQSIFRFTPILLLV